MPGAASPPELTLRAASHWRRFLAVFGPGLVVMLADTDVASVITTGQSGVPWSYRLLLQLILIPVLYMMQGLTLGLAILRGLYLWVVVAVAMLTCALGLFGGLSGAGLV